MTLPRSGSLGEVALEDLVQRIFIGRISGRLLVEHGETSGEIRFEEGLISDVSYGQLVREEAFYKMLELRDGRFALFVKSSPPARGGDA